MKANKITTNETSGDAIGYRINRTRTASETPSRFPLVFFFFLNQGSKKFKRLTLFNYLQRNRKVGLTHEQTMNKWNVKWINIKEIFVQKNRTIITTHSHSFLSFCFVEWRVNE